MKPASTTLINLLNSSTGFIMVDLYTFKLANGNTYYYSAGQTAVTANGHTYVLGPKFERSNFRVTIGVQVDEMVVEAYPDTTDTIPPDTAGALTFLQAAWKGVFDGATVQLERAFMPSYTAHGVDNYGGTVVLFLGRVGEVEVGRTFISIHVRSLLDILNIQMPRHLFQSQCSFVFGDSMCLFDRSTLAQNVLALGGSTQGLILTSLVPSPVNLYVLGTATCTAGANVGQSRSITAMTNGAITVQPNFLLPVAPADTFNLLPGCDHTLATCTNTFNNPQHFGGWVEIPVPETAI